MAMPNLITIDENDFAKNAAGLTVFWTLSGDVTLQTLADALTNVGSSATPPEEPSAVVALHRACDVVAKLYKLKVMPVRRGEYVLTSPPTVEVGADGGKTLKHAVHVTAKIEHGAPVVEGEGVEQIRAAFQAARATLAPADIGTWLCDKLRALKAIPLRDRGGVYFVPADLRVKWQKVATALGTCSAHKIHTLPTMKSADAIDAILAALTQDTRSTIDDIDEEIRGAALGTRALAGREKLARELRERVAHYETLLGVKLGELRASLDEVDGAIAAAVMTASSSDGQ